MNSQKYRGIDKTGSLVKGHFDLNSARLKSRLGITVQTQNQLLVIFKDGSYIEVIESLKKHIEYICATHLVCQKIISKEEMINLFEKGFFDDAFRSIDY